MSQTPWRLGPMKWRRAIARGGARASSTPATHGRCEALVAVRIREGHYATPVRRCPHRHGVLWPDSIHEGNGIGSCHRETATPDQRAGLVKMTSGKEGGTMFEILASVTPTVLPPIYAPIQFEFDQERRVGRLDVQGLGEFRAEPIRNPVTGEEHRARIDLPNGFEYKLAEMANCVENRATLGDKVISNRNSYAQFASIDWTNA